MSGLASGLRSSIWNSEPAAPSATPTRTREHRARQLGLHQDEGRDRDLLAEQDPEEVGDGEGVVAEQHADREGGDERDDQAAEPAGDGGAAAGSAARRSGGLGRRR